MCFIYQLLHSLKTKIYGLGSRAEFLKANKDAAAMKLSEGEAEVYYSFQNEAPPIFGGSKTDKSYISSLLSFIKGSYCHSQRVMGFDFEKFMVWVRMDVMEAIWQQYS